MKQVLINDNYVRVGGGGGGGGALLLLRIRQPKQNIPNHLAISLEDIIHNTLIW